MAVLFSQKYEGLDDLADALHSSEQGERAPSDFFDTFSKIADAIPNGVVSEGEKIRAFISASSGDLGTELAKKKPTSWKTVEKIVEEEQRAHEKRTGKKSILDKDSASEEQIFNSRSQAPSSNRCQFGSTCRKWYKGQCDKEHVDSNGRPYPPLPRENDRKGGLNGGVNPNGQPSFRPTGNGGGGNAFASPITKKQRAAWNMLVQQGYVPSQHIPNHQQLTPPPPPPHLYNPQLVTMTVIDTNASGINALDFQISHRPQHLQCLSRGVRSLIIPEVLLSLGFCCGRCVLLYQPHSRVQS